MLTNVFAELAHDEIVDHLRLIVRHRLREMTIELECMAILAGAGIRGRCHVGARSLRTNWLARHLRIVRIVRWLDSLRLQRGIDDSRLSVFPGRVLIGGCAMAVLTLHLHRLRIRTQQSSAHVNCMIELDGSRITEAVAQRGKLRMPGVEVVDRSLKMRRAGFDSQVAMALHAGFVSRLAQMLRADMFGMTGSAGWRKCLELLMRRSLMTAQASRVSDMAAEPELYKSGLHQRYMAGLATLAGKRMHCRKRSAGEGFGIVMDGETQQPYGSKSGKGYHHDGAG